MIRIKRHEIQISQTLSFPRSEKRESEREGGQTRAPAHELALPLP